MDLMRVGRGPIRMDLLGCGRGSNYSGAVGANQDPGHLINISNQDPSPMLMGYKEYLWIDMFMV